LQEVTARLTGPIAPGDTSFTPELTNAVGYASPKPQPERAEDLAHEPNANALLQPTITGETYVQ